MGGVGRMLGALASAPTPGQAQSDREAEIIGFHQLCEKGRPKTPLPLSTSPTAVSQAERTAISVSIRSSAAISSAVMKPSSASGPPQAVRLQMLAARARYAPGHHSLASGPTLN